MLLSLRANVSVWDPVLLNITLRPKANTNMLNAAAKHQSMYSNKPQLGLGSGTVFLCSYTVMSGSLEHKSAQIIIIIYFLPAQWLITSQLLFIREAEWIEFVRNKAMTSDRRPAAILLFPQQWQNGHRGSSLNDRMEEHTPRTRTEHPFSHTLIYYRPIALLFYVISNGTTWKVKTIKVALLAVVVRSHVLEGSESVAAWHVLLKLLFKGLEASTVLFIGAELGDVEARRMRHVDHIGVGQNHKLVLLLERMIK